MRKINRDAVEKPSCLDSPSPEKRYSHLDGKEKQEIRSALLSVQEHRCAYCERRTGPARDDGHIEHLRKQADNPGLDLVWENMFWSCNDEKTCGKFKDGCSRAGGVRSIFNPDDLIDPCVDNPDDFFLFVTDGSVRIKDGLNADQEHRARETLRVFQIADSAYLRKSREDAVTPYVSAVNVLLSAGPELVRQYVQNEKVNVDRAPFSAAIRQFFRCYVTES